MRNTFLYHVDIDNLNFLELCYINARLSSDVCVVIIGRLDAPYPNDV